MRTASQPRSGIYPLLRRVIDVRPEEVAVLFWCWLYIFAVLPERPSDAAARS